MKASTWPVGRVALILAVTMAITVSAFDVSVTDAGVSSPGRRLLGAPTKTHAPISKKPATTKVSLFTSSTTTMQTSGKAGGSGKNMLKAVYRTTSGAAKGTVMTANGFAVNNAMALTLTAAKKGKKAKGSIKVSSKLSGTSTTHVQAASMRLKLQKNASGRRLSATCDSVPVLVTAYYTISCAQYNIVLASSGQAKSTTCVAANGEDFFIASVQYNVSATTAATYAFPASFDGFSSIDIVLLDASCGVLVVQNLDISVSAGTLAVTPIVKKWATGQVVVALGNNKIDVRSKNSQSTFDLGGNYSKVVKGVQLFDTYDEDDNLIAVNLLVCKFSTSELANIAISSDGTHSVADTFLVQDMAGVSVQPIKAICSSSDGTCLIQAHRKSDNAVLLLTFDALDIVARSNTAKNPIPTDSIILDGALGGFDVSDSNTVSYGSGDGYSTVDVESEESSPAPAPAPVPAPAPAPMGAPGASPSMKTVLCSDVVLEHVAGASESEADILSTTVVACNNEIVEYPEVGIVKRTGMTQTKDGSSWSALTDVDYSLGSVYNRIKADYLGVTSSGKVTAFKLGGLAAPINLYAVAVTSGSAGIAVIELPASN